MVHLEIQELAQEQLEQILLDKQSQAKSQFELPAGGHTIIYAQQAKMPDHFRVKVSGPFGAKISNYLSERNLLYTAGAYNPVTNWYLFEERGASNNTFHIFDLASGSVATYAHPAIKFQGWRPYFAEFIFRDASTLGTYSWFAHDLQTGKTRCLFVGGSQAYISADGHFLIVTTPQEIFVALIELEIGKLIDRKLKRDLQALVEKPTNIKIVHFKPETPALFGFINWSETGYEKAIQIRVIT